jgi:hydrogenase maturation protein HypF
MIWGGEFLVGGYDGFRRAGHFRPLPLPGGDAAVREPWRMALSYLYQALGEAAFVIDHPVAGLLAEKDRALFARMLQRGINSPQTSSCGRLFDAVAALLNLRHIVSYDGQGAIELEALAETAEENMKSPLIKHPKNGHKGDSGGFAFDLETESPPAPLYQWGSYAYSVVANRDAPLQLDFAPMFTEILTDMETGVATAAIAHRFHRTVAASAADICLRIADVTGLDRIIFSGGVFQNRLLSEMLYTALTAKGLNVFTHRLVPPNDGGIALGQAAIAGRRGI